MLRSGHGPLTKVFFVFKKVLFQLHWFFGISAGLVLALMVSVSTGWRIASMTDSSPLLRWVDVLLLQGNVLRWHFVSAAVLTTLSDVPWNADFYASEGFAVVPQAEWSDGLRAVMAVDASERWRWQHRRRPRRQLQGRLGLQTLLVMPAPLCVLVLEYQHCFDHQ